MRGSKVWVRWVMLGMGDVKPRIKGIDKMSKKVFVQY